MKAVGLSNGTKVSYILDARGRRVAKMLNGKITQGFVYSNQNQVIAMLDAKGQINQSFDYASKSNSPDVATIGAKVYRIVSDQIGTPRLLIDSKTGQIAEASFSDEFGDDALNFGNSKIPFGFAGGIADSDTKLVHFGAREYDPEVGRWISKDPILFAGQQTNLYGYTFNDPINLVDPTGNDAQTYITFPFPHSVISVTNPSSPTGSTFFEFYPKNGGGYVTPVQGEVSSGSAYDGILIPIQHTTLTPSQDLDLINRAAQIQQQVQSGSYMYSLPQVGGRNCYGYTSDVCGSSCK